MSRRTARCSILLSFYEGLWHCAQIVTHENGRTAIGNFERWIQVNDYYFLDYSATSFWEFFQVLKFFFEFLDYDSFQSFEFACDL